MVAVVCAVAVGGCRRERRIPGWQPGNGGAALPSRSAGCGARAHAPGPHVSTVRIAGALRHYTVHVPAADPATPLPVVTFFHGRRPIDKSTFTRLAITGGFDEVPAVQRGAILVVPHGQPFMSERVHGWDLSCAGADVQFFDRMLDEVAARHCIDPRAVFAAGHSWGAEMAEALACCRGEKVRAIAASGGSNVGANRVCPAARIPAYRLSYGTRDSVYPQGAFDDGLAFFRAAHGCADESDPLPSPSCLAYRRCAQPVVVCAERGKGHRMPDDFASSAWAFFSRLLR